MLLRGRMWLSTFYILDFFLVQAPKRDQYLTTVPSLMAQIYSWYIPGIYTVIVQRLAAITDASHAGNRCHGCKRNALNALRRSLMAHTCSSVSVAPGFGTQRFAVITDSSRGSTLARTSSRILAQRLAAITDGSPHVTPVAVLRGSCATHCGDH